MVYIELRVDKRVVLTRINEVCFEDIHGSYDITINGKYHIWITDKEKAENAMMILKKLIELDTTICIDDIELFNPDSLKSILEKNSDLKGFV